MFSQAKSSLLCWARQSSTQRQCHVPVKALFLSPALHCRGIGGGFSFALLVYVTLGRGASSFKEGWCFFINPDGLNARELKHVNQHMKSWRSGVRGPADSQKRSSPTSSFCIVLLMSVPDVYTMSFIFFLFQTAALTL